MTLIDPIKKEIKETKKELKEKTVTLILGGFGVVAALAWNDAIQTFFNTFFQKGSSLVGKFIYAIIVTLIVVIVSMKLRTISEKKE